MAVAAQIEDRMAAALLLQYQGYYSTNHDILPDFIGKPSVVPIPSDMDSRVCREKLIPKLTLRWLPPSMELCDGFVVRWVASYAGHRTHVNELRW